MSGSFNRPQFDYIEHDDSQFPADDNTDFATAVVLAAPQGSVDPTLQTSRSTLRQEYGTISSKYGYGLISADSVLATNNPVLCLRVTDTLTARYGMMTLLNIGEVGSELTLLAANPNGSQQPYTENDTSVLTSYYSGTGVPSGTLGSIGTISFTGLPNLTVNTSAQTDSVAAFQQVNNSVLSTLLANYETADPTFLNEGAQSSSVLNSSITSAVEGQMASTLFLTEGVPASNPGFAEMSNNPDNAVWAFSEDWLMHIYAINPGDYINGSVSVAISNIASGSPMIEAMTLSSTLTPSSTIVGNIVVNGTNNSFSVPYVGTSDTTLADLCSEIENAIPGSTATILPVNNQVSGFTNILIAAALPSDTLQFNGWNVVGGTSPVTISTSLKSGATVGNNQFNLNVYANSNTNTPAESFPVTLYKTKDGFGYSLFAEDVINKGLGSTTSKSKYIRVVVNSSVTRANSIINPLYVASPTPFSGGNDGNLPTDSQIAAGWMRLSDRQNYDFWFVMTGGYNSPVVLSAIENLANSRADCFGIIDMPLDAFGNEASWSSSAGLTTSFTGTFAPYLLQAIVDTGTQEYCPPSGSVTAAYASNAVTNFVSLGVAGSKRGSLPNVLGVYGNYTVNSINGGPTLDICANNLINPIIKSKSGGYKINDLLTNQSYTSLLSYIPVRLVFIYIHRMIEQIVEQFEFDNITDKEMYQVEKLLKSKMKVLVDSNYLSNAGVQCSATNNPVSTSVTGTLNINVWGTGYAPIRDIVCNAYVTADDISYSDYAVGT